MAITNAQLEAQYLDILVVPTGKTYAITNILVCNNSLTDDATFDLHFVKPGQPISNNTTRVINNLTLPAGETFTFDSERIVLDEDDRIVFDAEPDIGGNLTNLSALISYMEL